MKPPPLCHSPPLRCEVSKLRLMLHAPQIQTFVDEVVDIVELNDILFDLVGGTWGMRRNAAR